MVNQLVAQFRGLLAAIDNVNVRSATLPNPIALETIMRNGSVSDFAQFDQAFRRTFQPLPRASDIDPGDRQRVNMSDALAIGTLKVLKASDQVVQQTVRVSQMIEDEAAQASPGSAAYLTGCWNHRGGRESGHDAKDAGGRTARGGSYTGACKRDSETSG